MTNADKTQVLWLCKVSKCLRACTCDEFLAVQTQRALERLVSGTVWNQFMFTWALAPILLSDHVPTTQDPQICTITLDYVYHLRPIGWTELGSTGWCINALQGIAWSLEWKKKGGRPGILSSYCHSPAWNFKYSGNSNSKSGFPYC